MPANFHRDYRLELSPESGDPPNLIFSNQHPPSPPLDLRNALQIKYETPAAVKVERALTGQLIHCHKRLDHNACYRVSSINSER
jgi:hypothetical protein